MKSKQNRAVFLDRDGVINVDKNYLYRIEEFEFSEGIFELLKKLQELGYLLIVVTNQSGIARGYYKKDDFLKLTSWMVGEFKKKGIRIEKVYYCPHKPDEGCECRKPKSGMFKEAIKEFDIDPKLSWMIGDKLSDIKAAKNIGINNTILLSQTKNNLAKFQANSIYDIIKIINQ